MTGTRDGVPSITVEALIDRYAVLLLDAYGVLVSSRGPLPGAAALIERLNAAGKAYYVVTNDASRLPSTTVARYGRWGLELTPDRVITSGQLLIPHFEARGLRDAPCAVLGPADSAAYVAEAGGAIVAPSEPFRALVIGDESGFPFLETVDTVLSRLLRTLDAGEPVDLVLPNPDLIYPVGSGDFGFASGSVAVMFEAALAMRYPVRTDLRFARLGKPYPPLFEEAVRRSGTRDMVMVGDQMDTDVRGAHAFGIDSVLVGTGVSVLPTAFSPDQPRPTYRLPSLV